MATVNLLNNSWTTRRQSSTIDITTSSTEVHFDMGGSRTDERRCAKACIAINATNYKSITLKYSSIINSGITSLQFGVFDSMTAEYYYNTQYDYGITSSSVSGVGVAGITYKSNQTITIDISDVTGTKYVGFLFYGNTNTFNEEIGWTAEQKVSIASLTATEKGYTITYNANGGSGTTVSQYVEAGDSVVLQDNGFIAPSTRLYTTTLDGNGGNNGIPTYKDNKFYKWKKDSPTGDSYDAGTIFKPIADTTFYAQWYTPTVVGTTTRSSITADGHQVIFDANGGNCSTTSLMAKDTTTYTFKEWNSKKDGSGYTWSSTATYMVTSNSTIYAIWSPTTTNGSITLPTPTRSGYEFLGWSTSEYDTNGIIGEYTPDSDYMVLYAIWKPKGIVYIYDDGSTFSEYQVFIYDGSGWNQYIPYIYIESGWELYSG